MELVSPMQRAPHKHVEKDETGGVLDDTKYEEYTEADLNPLAYPCGGAKAGRVHFDAEMGTKSFVSWKTLHADDAGTCILRLGESATDSEYDILYPTDGSAGRESRGEFPCGRSTASMEGKEIRFPRNVTCDACILQLEWKTSRGKIYMCSDIELMSGKIDDCSG